MQRSELQNKDMEQPFIYPFGWKGAGSVLIGNVVLSNGAAVYENCILKGDRNKIWIGPRSHVLEGTTISTSPSTPDRPFLGCTLVGDNVLIGANCTLDSCWVGDLVTVGNGCTIGFGARIENGAIIGAGSVVEPDQYIPACEVWVGRPARYLRRTGDTDRMTTMAETEELQLIHGVYEMYESQVSNVWSEYDKVADNLEAELMKILGTKDLAATLKSKDFDPATLKLPASLVECLIEMIDEEDRPTPDTTLSAKCRAWFSSTWSFNRSTEARPVFTGNANRPDAHADVV